MQTGDNTQSVSAVTRRRGNQLSVKAAWQTQAAETKKNKQTNRQMSRLKTKKRRFGDFRSPVASGRRRSQVGERPTNPAQTGFRSGKRSHLFARAVIHGTSDDSFSDKRKKDSRLAWIDRREERGAASTERRQKAERREAMRRQREEERESRGDWRLLSFQLCVVNHDALRSNDAVSIDGSKTT